jgi:hypothetical protein
MMLTAADFSVQTDAEREVRNALATYKAALIHAQYRNWLHRFSCWCQDERAIKSEAVLTKAEADARVVVNRSDEHKNWLRIISSQQPDFVREKDKFLSLLN